MAAIGRNESTIADFPLGKITQSHFAWTGDFGTEAGFG